MKGIGCRNIEKYVLNHNTEVTKIIDNYPRPDITLDNLLGVNSEHIGGTPIYAISA